MIYCVLASAACLYSDIALLREGPDKIIAVNGTIPRHPGAVDFGATVHREKIQEFRREGCTMVTTQLVEGADMAYDERPWRHGTSSLYAVGLALRMGARRVYLCGAPLDTQPHFYDDRAAPLGDDLERYRHFWREALPAMRGRVFSMSGWTRELLGDPPATDYLRRTA